jgi:predicted O-methyltransferase YrrM
MWLDYLRYYWRASARPSQAHAFVEAFCQEVLNDQRHFYAFDWAEQARAQLLRSQEVFVPLDLGAGSRVAAAGQPRRVANIAKNAASTAQQGRWLFRLIQWLQPQYKLELGTSLGLGSLYQYFANSGLFYTLEGCPQTAAQAQRVFDRWGASKIQVQIGPFEQTLPQVLSQLPRLDYLFLDGNHRLAPTLAYFEHSLPWLHEGSVVVVDDLYWSAEMKQAWAQLKAHPKVQLSIDVFDFGLLFFDPKHGPKAHYTLIPRRYKPWA